MNDRDEMLEQIMWRIIDMMETGQIDRGLKVGQPAAIRYDRKAATLVQLDELSGVLEWKDGRRGVFPVEKLFNPNALIKFVESFVV